jgi:hypothetical protein
MKKIVLLSLLTFALAACADRTGLLAPETLNADLQTTDVYLWFTSTPPDPAFVGNTYEVKAEHSDELGEGGIWLGSRTPDVCYLYGEWHSGNPVSATVTFLEAGTCIIDAYEGWAFWWAQQTFSVVDPGTAEVGIGSAVSVPLSNEVSLTFDDVTAEGSVSVTTETVDSDSDPQPPSNFQLGDPPTYYNITTSDGLEFEGSVRLCITYGDEEFASMAADELVLLHWDGSSWNVLENQTVDTTTNTVCADTDSFSPFAIAYQLVDDERGKRKAKGKGRSPM